MPAGTVPECRQRYEQYTATDHSTWKRLYDRIAPRWQKYANARFLAGVEALSLDPARIPRLDEVNTRLAPLTGFHAVAVPGYIPAFEFFDCLRRREFPTTVTVRPAASLDYLPEPDIFHDVAGHVPMHTDARFAATLVQFGECAHAAAEMAAGIDGRRERVEALASMIRALARVFWFTVEFGLMRTAGDGLRAYGSGLLSSYGELEHSLTSAAVQRYPMQLEWAVNQSFEIDHYQPLLFVVDGFDPLFELVNELERRLKSGRLRNVSGGEPRVAEADLESFLSRGAR